MGKTKRGAVIYKFPCGKGDEKGARAMLCDLFEKVLEQRFGGDLVSAAEAYSDARINQLADLMEAEGVSGIEYVDSDDYLCAMIGVMTEWLDEAEAEQAAG